MKILVLGSRGQIGKPFCEYALSKGHSIIEFDKKTTSKQDLAHLKYPGYFEECVKDADAVLFLAFEVGGSKYLEKKDKTFSYINENVCILKNTFEQLHKTPKPFLFASSQMANMHHTNYGFLKDLGERYTKTLEGHICRFWNVYGKEEPLDPKSHVITDFIFMAKQGEIKMRTSGTEERQFLHTDDCSRALMHWCENYSLYDKKEYIDITSFKWNSINDVASLIQKYIPCNIIKGENTDTIQQGIKNNPSDYILKFWSPNVSLENGIKKLIK